MEDSFSENPATPEELTGILEKMVYDRYLVKNPDGFLRPYKDGYDFHPHCPLDETDKAKVKTMLFSLRNKVFENERIGITTRGNLSIEDFLTGKPGKLVLAIQAEKAKGKEFFRSGGVVLFESDGKKIHPLDATGGIEDSIQEAISLEAHLYLDTLRWNAPPFIENLTKEKNAKVRLLWYLLKRGLLRHEFASMATVNQEEFFLEGKIGECFLEFKGNWQVPSGPTIANFFFLMSRREEDGVKRIRIAKTPNHLEDFFAQCLGEYSEEGNKFEGVPQPLQTVLQAAYRQVRGNAKKTAQVVP